ncbi:hypothetical protein ACFVSQ_26515 [Streptomyces niveus]|uniref:WXG100 family type VII secretion target n=1 Tax=Streptomyces niveus TaxID=193462 RepID=UPI0036EB4A1B
MSDDKKPPLSPQEKQQNEEAAQIRTEFGVVDVTERLATSMGGLLFGTSGGFFGRTSFEERALNDMLDLLDGANPSDLENAGKNLERAKNSLNDAAQGLSDFVKATDWHGEAATKFQSYGSELARYAWDLGSFANIVGTQMAVAATGLTSVRGAKPPRDNRVDPRRPKDFPVSEQREDNPEYKKAVQAEENRQEAINQMNRLASFYAVSEQSLAEAKEPVLPEMLAVPVPPAQGMQRTESESATTESGTPGGEPRQSSALRTDAGGPGDVSRIRTEGLVTEKPLPNVSMEIDSVKTLPPTQTGPGPTQPTPVTGGPPAVNPPVPPLGPNFNPTARGGAPRQGPPVTARAGGPAPTSRTSTGGGGRQGPPVGRPPVMGGGGTNSGTGANRSPVGRPTAMGPGAGRAGGPGATRSPVVGRPTSGTPVTGRSGSGTSSGSRTGGRNNGIVGGTPQRSSGNGKGNSGSRIPRGNVIGGQGQGSAPGRSNSAARPSQSGVVGTRAAQGAPRPTGRGTPSSKGVVGTPRSDGTPPRGGTPPKGGVFTTGGSGLTGGRGNRRSDEEEQERPEQRRPENTTDGEETRTVRRRGAVPPVID